MRGPVVEEGMISLRRRRVDPSSFDDSPPPPSPTDPIGVRGEGRHKVRVRVRESRVHTIL